MNGLAALFRAGLRISVVGAICLATIGCGTLGGTVAAGGLAATLLGGRTPGQDLEQTYYLGVFDPQEQVPPSVYRVRVRGQASILSRMSFASGWVHASLIDSLGTSIGFNSDSGRVEITKAGEDSLGGITTGRRMVVFGPEGFREAPKDHRLVIVMGSSPDKFFAAVDETMGVVARAIGERRHDGLNKRILDILTRAKAERDRLDALATQVERDITKEGGAS